MDTELIFLLENDFTCTKINNTNNIIIINLYYNYLIKGFNYIKNYFNYIKNYFNDELNNTDLLITIFIMITILFKKRNFVH